jgi:hypothetical protein
VRKCLLVVQGPLQIVAGLIALEWYGWVKSGSRQAEVVLLMQDFLVSDEIESPLRQTITNLSPVRQWKKTLFIGQREMSRLLKRRYMDSVRMMKATIGEESFDEVYVARRTGGAGNALVLNAYPDASRIVYGDSFGYVGYEEDLSPHARWSMKNIRTHIKSIMRKIIFGGPREFEFDAAVLTLPVDWSGTYLQNIPLIIPEKDFAVGIIQEYSDQLVGMSAYCDYVLQGSRNPYLFLLSNLSAAGMMSAENELAFYIESIRNLAETGATLLIKPHPRGQAPITTQLLNALAGEYSIRIMDDPRFSRIPIELWYPLNRRCRIATVLSSSCTYLKYFYGIQVAVPLNASSIANYIDPLWAPYVTKVSAVLLKSLDCLDVWDGRSPLWKGVSKKTLRARPV